MYRSNSPLPRAGAIVLAASLIFSAVASAQDATQSKGQPEDKFRQLDAAWPTPNDYRTASGAPGHKYWQQRADYHIRAALDEEKRRLGGSETITYTNNSPDSLKYLWMQLDQNRFSKHSDGVLTETVDDTEKLPFDTLRLDLVTQQHESGYNITSVRGADGKELPHAIVDTVMRIDLPQPLASGASVTFSVDWNQNIVEGKPFNARGGWEHYDKDGNDVFFLAQWYPRMSAYTDADGWNTKHFLGLGEFTLEFGDFDVEIIVPADHIVASTGELQNASEVLSEIQLGRLDKARNADSPVFIVTPEEAIANQSEKADGLKTWHFTAKNVRDFAFASSRKFIWDAEGYKEPSDGRTIMAMSFYPEEGMPLWDKYSTKAIVHTLGTYSKHTFAYPYPKAQSVMGPISGGMEYPMITANDPRPTIDKETGEHTYSRRAKYGLISVVIHEIGHTWFPMVVNSDERSWTWMDEGLNEFLMLLSEQEWEEGYRSNEDEPRKIADYMTSENQVPIMTQSDSILQFSNNAYAKPTAALNILRETVMGRDLFDFAFKEYANRWKFKRPYPADFFRTMEDASGMDLDWFWRGWFYTTDHVDISIDKVMKATVNTKDPDVEAAYKRKERESEPTPIMKQRDEGMPRRVESDPELLDLYNQNDEFTVTGRQREEYSQMLDGLEDWQKDLLKYGGNLYFVEFKNIGGLVMPLILDIGYADGTRETLRIPAEIWRFNSDHVTKMIVTDKEITEINLDPNRETADADEYNNHWPRRAVPARIELVKRPEPRNLMKEMRDTESGKNDEDKDKKDNKDNP